MTSKASIDMNSTNLTALHKIARDDEKALRIFFDDVLAKSPIDNDIYEIVNYLIETDLLCVHIIDHPIYIRMRDTFTDILQQQPVGDFKLLSCIGQLFSQMANHTHNKNIHLFQQLFANASLIEHIGKHLRNLSSTSHVDLISGIGYMIDAYQKFQRDRPAVKENPILSSLIMPIVNFIKSVEYKTSFFQLSSKQDQLTSFQKLILITCPKYIVSFWCKRQHEVALAAAQETLSRASEILQHFLSFIEDWNVIIIWCVFYLIWLCQYSADDYLLSAYNVQHEKIVNCVIKVVQGKELWHLANQDPISGSLQKRARQLVCYATLYIYAVSFSPELRHKLKGDNLTPILLKLTKANFDKTQFHAYRILAVILSSDDIKRLANPSQITAVFITYLEKSMNTIDTRARLENLLINLKSKLHHISSIISTRSF
jgi:hypothetical protein